MARNKKNIPFQKELFLSICGFFIIFVAITMSLQYYQEKSIRHNNLYSLLQEYNHHVANSLNEYLNTDTANTPLPPSPTPKRFPYRLTIIDINTGKVVLDNSSS